MVFSHFGNCYSLRCVPFFALLGVFTTVGKPKMVTERGKKLCTLTALGEGENMLP